MILIRATRLSVRTLAFADELGAAAGCEVAFILDGRHAVDVQTPRERILVTEAACNALGLHCPEDFAWRCGDYGLYLARRRFPYERHFWLFEHDVRLGGGGAALFAFFEPRPEIDLLACNYGSAGPGWYWHPHACARDVTPHRCMFGAVRISARALDRLLLVRRAHSRQWARRRLWPNDEALAATTLSNGAFACADLNAFGRVFYDDATWSLKGAPIRGETFDAPPDGKLYHPVLFGGEFDRGNTTAATEKAPLRGTSGLPERVKRRVLRALLSLRRWHGAPAQPLRS